MPASDALDIPLKPLWSIYFVELNPPTLITVLKLPDSFYTPKLLTTKISDDEKEIGFYPDHFIGIEQAVVLVPEFENVVRKLEQQVTLRGQSNSTLQNYIRRIALFVVHFGKLPEQIAPEEINEYLAALARDPKSPSRSNFKHAVYA